MLILLVNLAYNSCKQKNPPEEKVMLSRNIEKRCVMTRQVALHGIYGEGKFALVDDEDFDLVSKYTWYAIKARNGNLYAKKQMRVNGKYVVITMQGVIMGRGLIDHVNHNGIDNRKENLRFATPAQNSANCTASGVSKYLGVSWDADRKKWTAVIRKQYLGLFDTEREAALAYDAYARLEHEEFANLNFPEVFVSIEEATLMKSITDQKKLVCIRNHSMSGDNLYVSPRGARGCRACRNIAEEKRANKRIEDSRYA